MNRIVSTLKKQNRIEKQYHIRYIIHLLYGLQTAEQYIKSINRTFENDVKYSTASLLYTHSMACTCPIYPIRREPFHLLPPPPPYFSEIDVICLKLPV